MSQRSLLLGFGSIVLLILAIILGIAWYSGRVVRRVVRATPTTSPVYSPAPFSTPNVFLPSTDSTPAPTPGSGGNVNVSPSNTKAYSGLGFSFRYPANWGLLSCSNSKNFELDPTVSTDTPNVACDYALKPMTFLVTDNLSCIGDSIRLDNQSVVKSRVVKANGDIWYRWCVSNPSGSDLDISHRVSTRGTRATSNTDYSADVENIISNMVFGSGS